MSTVLYTSYKISSGIDLKKVAAFFRLPAPESWEHYILLDEEPLSEVYKYKMPSKKISIFEFGCVTFENFHMDEIGEFLKYLQLIIGDLDYRMFAKYNESLPVEVLEDHSIHLWEGSNRTFPDNDKLAGIVAVVHAKSVALSKIETDVEVLLDEAENFIAKQTKNAKILNQ